MNKLVYDKKLGTGSINNITLTVAPTFSFEYEYILVTGDTGVYTTSVSADFPNIELDSTKVLEVKVFIDEYLIITTNATIALEAQEAADKVEQETINIENERKQDVWDSEPYASDRAKRSYLEATDWYIIREIERGTAVPLAISTKRLEYINTIQQAPLDWEAI